MPIANAVENIRTEIMRIEIDLDEHEEIKDDITATMQKAIPITPSNTINGEDKANAKSYKLSVGIEAMRLCSIKKSITASIKVIILVIKYFTFMFFLFKKGKNFYDCLLLIYQINIICAVLVADLIMCNFSNHNTISCENETL